MRGPRRLLLLLLPAVLPLALPSAAAAQRPVPERQAFVVLLDPVPLEEALRDPLVVALAAEGGAGLLTAPGDPHPQEALVAVGAGAMPDGAPADRPFVTSERAGVRVDVWPFLARAGSADPGLLGSALAEAGLRPGYVGSSAARRGGLLVAMDRTGRVPLAAFERFVGLEPLAIPGTRRVVEEADLVVLEVEDAGSLIAASPAREVLVLAMAPVPSEAMREGGDEVAPVALARGTPEGVLAAPAGALGGLTSATTRRDGVVTVVDVAPTVLEFLGVAIPEGMDGAPIRVEGRAPVDLHARYLELRQVVAPVGVAPLVVAFGALAVGVALLYLSGSSPAAARAAGAAGLFGVSAAVALVPASLLPMFVPPVAVAGVLALAVLFTAVALGRGTRGPYVPPAVVAGVGATLVVVDGLLGWPSTLTPLTGGGALQGIRFYGVGNSLAGVLLAGGVLGAAFLRPWAGVSVLAGAALFAGLPGLGADLGGGLTLFAVAGLWYALRVRGRLGLGGWAMAAVAGVAGVVLLVLAHQILAPEATHVSRAVEGGGGVLGVVGVFVDRLLLNLRGTAALPAIWPALLGLPVAAAVAAGRLGPFREPLERSPAWRDATLALALGGMIGFVVNDTHGMATVAFVFLALALVYPALEDRWTSG